jgi:hypothetical protein
MDGYTNRIDLNACQMIVDGYGVLSTESGWRPINLASLGNLRTLTDRVRRVFAGTSLRDDVYIKTTDGVRSAVLLVCSGH